MTQEFESNISRCKSCDAEIVWLKTKTGKNIPVDIETCDLDTDELFNRETMKCHFETCVNADQHRTRSSSKASAPTPTPDNFNAKRLNTALAALEDIAKNQPDGMRSSEIAKAALSQIRSIR